ncbi:mechanosensitive ion channel domain-containing protein [Allorhizobium undicola]|uniref:mechanosensitive ion channel domain-containing protein n=1 Tax=Allorhizobium undicola TaxID=78527 RepID=UPI003D34A291
MTNRFFIRIVLVCLIAFSATAIHAPLLTPAFAQDSLFAPDDPVSQAPQTLAKAQKQIDAANAALSKPTEDDRQLTTLKSQLDDLQAQLTALRGDVQPRADDIANRQKEMGDPPKDGQQEASDVTQQRNKLAAQKTQIATVISQLDDASNAINATSAKITAIRRDLFTRELMTRTDVPFDRLAAAVQSIVPEMKRFAELIGGWAGFAWRFKKVQLASALLLSLVLAVGMRLTLNRIFGPVIQRASVEDDPSYMSRFSLAFWVTTIPTLAVSFFLTSSYFFLEAFNVLRPDISPIAGSVMAFAGLVYFVFRLGDALFQPSKPKWRLVRVTDRGAKLLLAALVGMSVINGLDYVFGSITETLGSPVDLTVFKGFVSSSLIGCILLAMSFARPLVPKGKEAQAAGRGRPWHRSTAIAMRLFGIGIILASVSGFIGLARFISTQLILTGGVIATMYIGIRSGRAVSERDRFADTIIGRYLQRRFNMGPVALDQVGIVAGLLIYMSALAFGIPLIMMSWGFQPPDIQTWFYNLFVQINIGGMSISIVGIFSGVAIFFVGLVLTRWFEKWLDGNVMARSQVDAGVRNSVKTSVGYFGAIIAALMALSVAGINLSSLALVAGALSVGIGFGLQNIISNFVSGLILLMERPFKVGDWVATGTSEGFVRRISVRATEIETFQRQSIIVPNSQLINASVGNWTHRNKLGRVDVPVTVKAGNDPRRMVNLLKDIATNVPGVLRNPEPVVVFKDFNEADLNFEVRVYVADILSGLSVRTELRLGVFERFKLEGILQEDPPAEEDAELVDGILPQTLPPEGDDKTPRSVKLGRLVLGVAAPSHFDPRHIMHLLKDIAASTPGIAERPEPRVIFKDFTEAELQFEIRAYVEDLRDGLSARNDLRLAIFQRFKQEGILHEAAPAIGHELVNEQE